MKKITVSPDLENERNKTTFNVEELTYFLDEGRENTEERRNQVEFFSKQTELADPVPVDYLSYVEKYENSMRKCCLFLKKCREYVDSKQVKDEAQRQALISKLSLGLMASAIHPEGNGMAIQYIMFIPMIMNLGTPEQQKHWLDQALNNGVLGTYAQTELGHGTFVRGLETNATYDPNTEEFVLNSPTLTSYKWWPAGLGHTANHAVVLAQLYTKGKCHGIHPFIVQLRDLETHMPMKGIKIGEIGCKLGMHGTNQGYLGFDHIRIPRDRLLMKHSQVLKDGTYIKKGSDKLTYGTMVLVRVGIVSMAAWGLCQAVTIATRYSAVRKQSELISGTGESIIMEYKTQQYKLFPHIASTYAMFICSRWIKEVYAKVTRDMESGNMAGLPELHALSCGLKAVSTKDSVTAIEELRKACGGHGYMTCSKFPSLYSTTTAAETYEGENTVLLLQTARFLLKTISQGSGNDSTTKYISLNFPNNQWVNNIDHVITAHYQVSQGLLKETANRISKLVSSGMKMELAWNENAIQLVQCSEAHCRAFLVNRFYEVIRTTNFSPSLKRVLMTLSELYSVYWLLKNLGGFLMYSNVKISDVPGIVNWQNELLGQIRPNAVALVDAFDIDDFILGSPLGAYDGDVYKRLFQEASKSPLNAEPVNKSFHKYLKPFLNGNL